MMSAPYEILKFWLPVASAFALAIKGFNVVKKSVEGWAETLFENHLSHIQEATTNTVIATNTTNDLLKASALRDIEVARNVIDVKTDLRDHNDKEMQVWQGVVNTLAVLEDRTKRSKTRTPRRK